MLTDADVPTVSFGISLRAASMVLAQYRRGAMLGRVGAQAQQHGNMQHFQVPKTVPSDASTLLDWTTTATEVAYP